MLGIYQNHCLSDDEIRKLIFKGELIINSCNDATQKLTDHAKKMIHEAFSPLDPEVAQEKLSLNDFVHIVSELKTKFTNDDVTKALVKAILVHLKLDLNNTYFDVPRLRVVTYNDYLSSGVGYAYRPHRDTWYSSPTAQVNFWMPVFNICAENAMAFYPEYWSKPIKNSSIEFDYEEWKQVGRKQAVQIIENDTRKHPLPLEHTQLNGICIAGCSGDLLMFSAAHLHATIPNGAHKTRFSLDFRTVNMLDLAQKRGAWNIDSQAKGTTLGDFIRASDFSPMTLAQQAIPV